MFPDLTRDDVFRLETRRLWLRWPRQSDAAAIVRGAGEKAVAEMTARIPHPYPPEAATEFVLHARRSNMDGTGLVMAVTTRRDPARLIGVVGLEGRPERPELGYWFAPEHWGEGYATEAARALLDAYFGYAQGQEVVASARVINPASRRVLERCGFSHVGSGLRSLRARGGAVPVDEFRLDRRDWASFKAWSSAGFVPTSPCDDAALHA